jgi:hypothetical protein
MTFVVNKAGTDASPLPKDSPWTFQNRTNAGSPNGTLTPQYAGELVEDTTNHVLWKAMSPNNNTWVALTPPA